MIGALRISNILKTANLFSRVIVAKTNFRMNLYGRYMRLADICYVWKEGGLEGWVERESLTDWTPTLRTTKLYRQWEIMAWTKRPLKPKI